MLLEYYVGKTELVAEKYLLASVADTRKEEKT